MDGKGTMYKIYRHLELNDVQWLSHRIINIYIYTFFRAPCFFDPPCLFDPPQPGTSVDPLSGSHLAASIPGTWFDEKPVVLKHGD